MTSRLAVKFHKAIKSDETQVTVRARLTEQKRNIAFIHVEVENAHGILCAEGDATYFVMSKEKSEEMGFTSCGVEQENLLPF